MQQRMTIRELIDLVEAGKSEILESGAWLLSTGELYTFNGRLTSHGNAGYVSHGCRCDACCEAARAWRAEYKRSRPIPTPDYWEDVRARVAS